MRIAIIGPGAVGLLFAGYLHLGGAEVRLVDEDEDRADLLNGEGFRWEGPGGDLRFTLPVSVGMADPGSIDLVILCVKAYQTNLAAGQIADSGYRGPVLTLQNGAGNAEIIGHHCPDSAVIAGTTSEGASLVDPCHVRHAGRGETVFGPVRPGAPGTAFLHDLVSIMRGGGLDASIYDDPERLVWSKVIVNAAINPLTALLSVTNGRLLDIKPARELMAGLVREGFNVARRKGVSPTYGDPVARVEEVCRLTSGNYSSMCQDVRHGRRTEIDFINGAIVREGAILGLPCPLNETMLKLIRSLEFRNAGME